MADQNDDRIQRIMAIVAASQGAALPPAGQRKPGDLATALRDVMRVGGPRQTDPFSQSTAPPGGEGAIFLPPERNKPAEILSGLADLFRGLKKAGAGTLLGIGEGKGMGM